MFWRRRVPLTGVALRRFLDGPQRLPFVHLGRGATTGLGVSWDPYRISCHTI